MQELRNSSYYYGMIPITCCKFQQIRPPPLETSAGFFFLVRLLVIFIVVDPKVGIAAMLCRPLRKRAALPHAYFSEVRGNGSFVHKKKYTIM